MSRTIRGDDARILSQIPWIPAPDYVRRTEGEIFRVSLEPVLKSSPLLPGQVAGSGQGEKGEGRNQWQVSEKVIPQVHGGR